MKQINTILEYQDLTFEVLDKLIKEECKKGNSKLDLTTYKLGCQMGKYLENRGFNVYMSSYSDYKYISW